MSGSTSVPDSGLPNWSVLKVIWSCQKTQPEDVWSNGPMVYACQFIRTCQVQSCENRTNKPTNTCWINIQATWEATKKETLTNQFNPFLIFHVAQPSHKWYSYLSGQSVKSRQPLPQGNPWKNPWKTAGSVYQHHQPSSKTRSPASITITWLLGLGSGSPRFGFCRWKVGCFGSSPSSNCSAPPAARSVLFLSLENFLRTNNFEYWKGIGLNFKFFALP